MVWHIDHRRIFRHTRGMETSLFDYHLPPQQIATHSMEPREQARLLVVDRKTEDLVDKHIFDLPELIQPGDLLIFNDSKVFKARLIGDLDGREIEIFLLRPEGETGWLALAKPGKKLRVGDVISLADHSTVRVQDKRTEEGTVVFDFARSTEEVFAFADKHGEVPLPPYVPASASTAAGYQTVYAKERGSVAAPTAGFHFTEALLAKLAERGVERAFVTLHVGMGTFRPMKTDTLEAHQMHEEWIMVPEETVKKIKATKARGGRVIAVGTTTVRALESAAHAHQGIIAAFSGFTSLFITPGYTFNVIDGLITNFHLPKSTLLVLVSSLAGREKMLEAYTHAIEQGYRFYSFGDAMLIV